MKTYFYKKVKRFFDFFFSCFLLIVLLPLFCLIAIAIKYEDFTKEQQKRFEVLPGITGLAQINGRKSLNLEKKFEYDIQYVNSMCFTLDLKIFFSTLFILTKDNY